MDRRSRRALGVALVALGVAAAPAQAAPGVSVSSLSSLKAGATAGTLNGTVVNDTGHAKRAAVTVRIFRRGTDAAVIGRTAVDVGAHGKADYRVKVALPSSLERGNYYLGACTSYGKGDGSLGCATAQDEVLIGGGTPVRPATARAAQAPAECGPGGRSLQPAGSRLYPETGNTGYKSLHTDIHLVYDAPSNLFLDGTYVDLQQRADKCLTEFSLDFERSNGYVDPSHPEVKGPDLTVKEITINGVPVTYTFKQPTFPGNPNGPDDPNPLAHAASNSNPVSASNPNPPACAPVGPEASLQGLQCPATKLVITPSAPIPAGTDFKVQIKYTGRPGVHVDGDGATEGWFRNENPAGDGGFMTTEPVGSMAWMPLNNHPTSKPTYEFWSTTNWDSATGTGRTAISNGRLIGFTDNAADALFPGGSRTWHWKSPEPIANYLVENSIGNYEMTERVSPSGTVYYTAQAAGISATRKVSNKAVMDRHEEITNFQIPFNGPFPFSTNGVIIGLPSVSFAEEMQTKITFQGGSISFGTFNHENMHQWWGDNVSEDIYERTFFKEGYADLSEGYNTARTAATNAGGLGTPAGDAAFEASLVTRFNNTYNGPNTSWAVAPSKPTNANLFGSQTYTRSGRAYIALRAILGAGNFDKASKEIQTTYGGSSITQPQQIAIYKKWLPVKTAGCTNKLDAFFQQWWDTAYTGAGNKPTITGPGLAGGGFYDANGGCSPYGTDTTGTVDGSVPATLSLTLGAPGTFAPFTPGFAKTYTATTEATVTTTAGEATLSVADTSANKPGYLVNGSFALPKPLGGLGVVKAYTGPASNDKVNATFTQEIGATDALRTGTYSKTLTFTLSTTQP
ncbi:peptidase M1-like protein [Solirubrobacter pauli]|uniref:Peptidase M1-like protein n=1 Tax=Solirubrobacter pauli TaxID=166793 RepID=A0A660LAZ8_9ACTN|nr:M1 family aminopeptidase [Solirubrobacter pauli]RKQ91576.1 peptidase M1-like protein [Solirubrobacter pauli]